MWVETHRIKLPHLPYQFHLHGISDLQLGSDSTSLKVIKARIDEILRDPVDSGVVIAGDIEDEDRPTTRAIRKAVFADRPEVTSRDSVKHMAWLDKEVIPMLLPIQKTKYGVMGALAGHHWTQLTPTYNSVEYICRRLYEMSHRIVPYLGEMSAFMDFRFCYSDNHGARSVGHIQHGEGSGGKASAIRKLDLAFAGFDADWYIRAHDCQIIASKFDRLYPRMTRRGELPSIGSKTISVLNLGSATQGYGMNRERPSYVESKMMRPVTMGWGTIQFDIHKKSRRLDKNANVVVETRVLI